MGRARRGRADPLATEVTQFGQFGDERAGVIGPTPGTEARRSSFSRHAGDPRTEASISASISESSFSSAAIRRAMLLRIRLTVTRFSRLRSATIISMIWRRFASDEVGEQLGQLRRRGGRKSGLGRLDEAGDHARVDRIGLRAASSAWAKWRTCAGLTITSGNEARRRAPPPRSSPGAACRLDRDPLRLKLRVKRATAKAAPSGQNVDVEPDLFDTSTPTYLASIVSTLPLPCATGLLRPKRLFEVDGQTEGRPG